MNLELYLAIGLGVVHAYLIDTFRIKLIWYNYEVKFTVDLECLHPRDPVYVAALEEIQTKNAMHQDVLLFMYSCSKDTASRFLNKLQNVLIVNIFSLINLHFAKFITVTVHSTCSPMQDRTHPGKV